jgi:hypothetical protein
MNDPLAAAREVLAGVRERYPAPLAALAAELLYEFSAARPNHMRCFLLEVDLFEVSVAFFSFVQLAHLHRAGVPLRASEAAVGQLRDNPALCTGHWWGLLRETARDVRKLAGEADAEAGGPPRGLALELAGLYFDPAGKAAALGKVLDQVPGLRNRVKGHAWTLTDEQYEAHARELLGTVVAYLSGVDFLQRHVLLQCLACEPEGDEFCLDVALLVGDARRPRRSPVRSVEALVPGRLYLAGKDEVAAGRLGQGAALGLHPFVQARGRDNRPETLYLLQALREGAAELRGVVGGDAVTCPQSGKEARALLDALMARSPTAGPFARVREAVAAVSRDALGSSQGRASYRAATYFVRPRLVRQVEEFAASRRGVALLAAPSGMGKTALACYLADRWLLSAAESEAVLIVFAQELAAAGDSLEQWARRRLGFPLEQLRDVATQGKARVLVVVDGLERARDRRAVLEEAAALAGAADAPLRILFTATESVLPELLRASAGQPGGPPQLIVMPPLNAAEARRLYETFRGPDEAEAEPPEGVLETLGTPLLIRLARAAARPGEDVSAAQVLLAYTEQVIFSDLARAELVHRLADRILGTGARSVPVADLARDEWMRSALLSEGPDGPLQGLVRDGVLFVEWVPPTGGLPLPAEPAVGFTFDQLRDFVVFARLGRRTGTDLSALADASADAAASSPFVGGLRFLVLERLRGAPPGVPPEEVLDLLHLLHAPCRQALLRDLFLVPIGPRMASALEVMLRALFTRLDAGEQKGFLEAAHGAFEHLERKGLTDEAGALCGLARELGLDTHPGEVLPLTCAWSRLQLRNVGAAAAQETARAALQRAQTLPDPSFRAEAPAVLAEALYLSGRRQEAAELLLSVDAAGAGGLSERAHFHLALAVARVLHEVEPEAAGRARSALWQMARASGNPLWLALACSAELGNMLGSPQRIGSPEAIRLSDEWLAHARRAGHPAQEAEACRYAAWSRQKDLTQEQTLIETGLEAAEAGRDVAGRAELLLRRANWLLRVGRFGEAEGPAREAGELFDRLGYRERALRLRQHTLVVIEWELGRPGRSLTLLRGNLDGHESMGMATEAGLSALLIAVLSCDVGDALAADAMLAKSRDLTRRGGGRLNYDLLQGRILQLKGDAEGAVAAFGRARDDGVASGYADLVYQPGILAARLLLEQGKDAEAETLLQQLLEDRSVDGKHRERYEGELYTLYARLQAGRCYLEQVAVWLDKADAYFAHHPVHRGVPEWRAMRLVRDRLTADRLEHGGKDEPAPKRAKALKSAQGIRSGVAKRLQPEVLDVVRAMAATFDDPREQNGYYTHHPVHALLKQHGVAPAPGG